MLWLKLVLGAAALLASNIHGFNDHRIPHHPLKHAALAWFLAVAAALMFLAVWL